MSDNVDKIELDAEELSPEALEVATGGKGFLVSYNVGDREALDCDCCNEVTLWECKVSGKYRTYWTCTKCNRRSRWHDLWGFGDTVCSASSAS